MSVVDHVNAETLISRLDAVVASCLPHPTSSFADALPALAAPRSTAFARNPQFPSTAD